jgi:hypothetical protein
MRGTREYRSPRVRTSITAVLVDSDGGEMPVEVADLSSAGFRLHAEEALVVGEKIRLRVPRYGDFPAQIKWVKGHEAGGLFLERVVL